MARVSAELFGRSGMDGGSYSDWADDYACPDPLNNARADIELSVLIPDRYQRIQPGRHRARFADRRRHSGDVRMQRPPAK
ncbi:hypothetical protein GCM10007392_40620 [Saccharospirillum salsuginis]|uniref:Uncharacterized protein n=1 Tax=Saccharospirillum salsuginis TaxID=418750 RepID=A0A918NHY7_9GAMM|nr:hypothetical protein GCM10007392_40620 [Saccharospirillum salsuginis]